jgi:hypothetical protein
MKHKSGVLQEKWAHTIKSSRGDPYVGANQIHVSRIKVFKYHGSCCEQFDRSPSGMMKTKIALVLVLASLLVVAGCSSSGDDKAASKNSAANPQNIANSNIAANGVVVTNGTAVSVPPIDTNATASSDVPQDGLQSPGMMMQKRGDKLRQSGGSSEKVDVAAIAMKSARPAPDNSTFTSYLAEAGYEIRTFNQHPQLLKVEKKTENNGNQTVKIFLRNGQVIARAGKDIPVLSTAAAVDILAAAGLAPSGPAAPKKPPGN